MSAAALCVRRTAPAFFPRQAEKTWKSGQRQTLCPNFALLYDLPKTGSFKLVKFIFCLFCIVFSRSETKNYRKIGTFDNNTLNCVFFAQHLLLIQTGGVIYAPQNNTRI